MGLQIEKPAVQPKTNPIQGNPVDVKPSTNGMDIYKAVLANDGKPYTGQPK